MKLTILGAGIAGACAYRAALDLGHEPTVHTINQPGASTIALATLHTEGAHEAAEQYERWGVPVQHGAWTTGYRRRNPTPTFDPDWRAIDPVEALNIPTTHEPPTTTPNLDCTAQPSWGTVTWGGTWINPNPDAFKPGPHLHLHHYAPYQTLTGVAWPSGARIGSSNARTPEKAAAAAHVQYETATNLDWIDPTDPNWTLHINYRVNTHHIQTHHGTVRFGGFHRDGYTLAALHAHQAIQAAAQ